MRHIHGFIMRIAILSTVSIVTAGNSIAGSVESERLSRALNQVEALYRSPEAAGLDIKPEHRAFLENELGGLPRVSAAGFFQEVAGVRGYVEYTWLTPYPPYPIRAVLVSSFTANVSGDGILTGIVFDENNLFSWEHEISKELYEYKKKSALMSALRRIPEKVAALGFSKIAAIPVISWESGIVTGIFPAVYPELPEYAYSKDGAIARTGVVGYNATEEKIVSGDRFHYFMIEVSGYDSGSGIWEKADIVKEEVWEGVRPDGKIISVKETPVSLW